MDVRSIEGVAPVVEHNGTVPVWWLVNPREMKDITDGGFLELVSEFEVAGGGLVDPHSHPTHEFYYVTAGRGIMMIDGEEREIGQGDLVHIPPNLVHSLRPVSDHAPIHCFCFAVGVPGAGPVDYTDHSAITAVARVLVTHRLPDGGLEPLASAGHELVQRLDDESYTHAQLVAAATEVDAIVRLLTDRIDREVLEAGAGRLHVVANVAVGYDNVDVAAANELGIAVCNTPGVLDETTADLAFLLILAASRLAHDAEADLRAGRWKGWGIMQYLGRDVHAATLGLVGFGRIGQAVARRAAGFGMNVLHHCRTDTGLPGWTGDLDRLLTESDVVSLHVPLSDATRHLIGARELGLMRATAVLVNTSRGPVVDEEALAIALEEQTIFAAGLDVFEREPEVHPRLLAAPRTVLLPHIGSATTATRTRMAVVASDGARAVLAGERPTNLVSAS